MTIEEIVEDCPTKKVENSKPLKNMSNPPAIKTESGNKSSDDKISNLNQVDNSNKDTKNMNEAEKENLKVTNGMAVTLESDLPTSCRQGFK